jgi:Ca2+-binding RTX toxin-like protein
MTQQTTTTYNSDGSYTVFTTDFVGDTTTQNYSAAAVLLNDTWTKSDGSSGADTFNADGSSSGNTLFANGTTSSYVNDGQGDITTKFFNTSGVETNDTWSKSDGSSGTDTFNSDGSSSGTVQYANGNTSTYTNDGKGNIDTTVLNSAGNLLSQTFAYSNGTTETTIDNGTGAPGGIVGRIFDFGNATNNSVALYAIANTTVTGGNGSNYLSISESGGSVNDVITLGDGNNVINTGNGTVAITVGGGNDSITLSTGTALVNAGNGNDTIIGAGADTITAGNGNDLLESGNGASVLTAGSGTDTLNGGSGVATLNGGSGTDTFIVGNSSDVITGQTASDIEESSVSVTAAANIVNLVGIGNASIALTGMGTITANSGNDTLAASQGAVTMNGGSGNDTFVVDNAADVINVAANSGTSTVQSSINYVLPSNIQNLTGYGTGNLTLTGNALADVLTANSGNDTLIAGSGLATLVGGSGNDTFVVNNAGDTITEAANSGNNTEDTSFSTTLAANVQNLTGTGSAALTLTGNAQVGVITANSGADTLIAGSGLATLVGGSGTDTFVVNNAGDVVNEAFSGTNSVEQTSASATLAANLQTLTGTGSANLTLTGNNLNDVITSNTGIDTLVGGSGNDTFVLNNANDVISEAANSGNNTEVVGFSTTLASNVQNLTGTGNASLLLSGNLLANVITANNGTDTLTAGSGLATLVGGIGRDTFVVNNSGDVINEAYVGTGSLEQTSVSTTLAKNLQNLTGTGNANLTLTGNNLNDVVTSNTGIDTLVGGTGNETFVVNNFQDVINTPTINAGNDTIVSSVNWNLAQGFVNLTGTGQHTQLTGNSGNDVLTDNGAYNTLVAGSGNDTLVGSTSGDTLVGGAGNDTFVLNSTSDTIVDQFTGTNNSVVTSVGFSGTSYANIQNVTGTGYSNMTLGVGINVVNGLPVAGNYVITSNQGVDTLQGGFGNNTFVVNNSSDYLQTQPASLNISPTSVINTVNTVDTSVSYTVAQNVQNLTGTGNANIALTDNSNLNEVITSNYGFDTLTGGTGINTYVINNAWDVINAPYQSTSVIDTSVNYTVNPNVVNTQTLTGIGNANIALSDNNQLNDVITSNSGIDTLTGGSASNTFVINNSADIINPVYGSGTTTIDTSVNYLTSANVQTMTGIGSANILIGDVNSLNDVITSNSGIDTLIGGSGNDTFVVNNSADAINLPSNNLGSTVDSSVNYAVNPQVQTLTGIGSANISLVDNNGLNDVITSNSGVDTLIGGSGNNTFVVNNSADQVYAENTGSNINTIDSSVSYVLPYAVQDLILTGSATVTGTANGGSDLIVGNNGTDTLTGQSGIDVLEAGSGTDTLSVTNAAGALIAGAGNDTLLGGSGPAFLAAGAGNDAITLGTGASVVAYNTGDGKTAITAGAGGGNVLSLGHGTAYSNLSFSKSGNNLILNTGSGAITLNNWYSGGANQDFVTLQVIEQSASTYSATSTNPLYNQGVEEFNFGQLVSQFNAALAAQPTLTSWNLMNGLLSAHMSGSNTAAFGGDLAYYDGMNGNLTGMNLSAADSTLGNSSFGRTTQTIDSWSGINNSNNKLR